MASLPNSKIVLKNTTKMSLNERFTVYRQQLQNDASTYREKMLMQRQATAANRRLAQQMANRPSVIAALRLKKKSLQQRLGQKQGYQNSSIKARLNLSTPRPVMTPMQNRLGNRRIFRGKNNLRNGGFRPGTSPLIKARLGNPQGQTPFRAPFRQRMGFRQNRRGGSFGRNPRGRGAMRAVRGTMQKPAGPSSAARGRWNSKPVKVVPTKQELDNQLDEYMAETKSSLDAQLNQYMSNNF